MQEPIKPVADPSRPETKERLESWKEIAAYLGREVRTVQGWEKNEALPIHRHQHARFGSVYAFKAELDAWREARRSVPEPPAAIAETQPRVRRPILVAGIAALILILVVSAALWSFRRTSSNGETMSSVVVLPFLDMSPQKDQEYFSDGLTEEIIDALSRVPNLRVVARTSAFAFKGKAADIREIGKQLNVTNVLEGSVRKSGDQLRITAQLNRASDGTHLWSRTYDRQLRDIFAVQREISQAIAGQLRAGQVSHRAPTTDMEAYRLYQEGRYFFNQHIPPDSYRKAIERYQQAVARDPNFALAYAGMADAYAYLCENMAVAPRDVMPKAKEAAERAVALDDRLGEAHISLGIVKMDYDWDREAAQSEFRKAMQLSPGSSWAHHWYAHSLESQGRVEEATKEMRAALALDPLSVPIYWDIGSELNWTGKYDESIRHLDRARELFPNQPIVMFMQAWAYFSKGDVKSGQQVIDALKASAAAAGMDKEPVMVMIAGWASAMEGHRAEAEAALAQLEQQRKTQYVEPLIVTWICSALHDPDAVLKWLRRGYEERSTLFVYAPLNKHVYGGVPGVEAIFAQGLR